MKTHYQHQVVLFAEKSEDDFSTPLKIGNLFFNRFGADEEASFEMVGAYALQKSSYKWPKLMLVTTVTSDGSVHFSS